MRNPDTASIRKTKMYSTMKNKSQKINRNEYFWILGILIIALIPRIYLFILHQVIDFDGVYYAMLGKNLFSGAGYIGPEGIYQWYYPPLYPVNIGIFWYLFGNIEFSCKFVSLIFGLLSIPFFYLISRKIYGKQVAIISGTLAALHPNLIRFSTTDTAESLFIFLLFLIIFLTLNAVQLPKNWLFYLIGTIFGLLFLSKATGIQYFAAYIALLVLIGLIKKWNKALLIKRSLVVIILFSIFTIPYLQFLKDHYGYWTLSELTTRNMVRSILLFSGDNQNKVYQLNSEGTELRYFTSANYPGEHLNIFERFKENPGNFIKRYAHNFIQEFALIFDNIKIFAIPIILFLFIHFFHISWERNTIINELILLSMLFPLLIAPLVCISSRWVLPMVPIIIIWSSNGMAKLQHQLVNRFEGYSQLLKKYFIVVIVLLWAVGITMPFLRNSKSYTAMYPYEHKELGLWMKENLSLTPSTTVMSASPHVAFYANTKLKIMPWGTAEQVINYARYHNIQYIVIDDHFLGRARSQLKYFKDIDNHNSPLRIIKEIIHHNGKRIRLYILKDV